MRIQRSLLVLPLLLVALTADARHPRDDRPLPLATQLDNAIRRTWHPDGPGATVLVVRDGETLFRKAVFKKIAERCKRTHECPQCGAFNGSVKKAGNIKIVPAATKRRIDKRAVEAGGRR